MHPKNDALLSIENLFNSNLLFFVIFEVYDRLMKLILKIEQKNIRDLKLLLYGKIMLLRQKLF